MEESIGKNSVYPPSTVETEWKKIMQEQKPKSKLRTQIGKAVSADFSKGTWEFRMGETFEVCAGEFAILPKHKYDALIHAVNGMRNSMSAHPDYEPDSEFDDMCSRVDEILLQL